MPFLQFFTTLPAIRVGADFQLKSAQLLNQVLKDKPLERIVVHLVTDQYIFSGNDLKGTEAKAYGVLRRVGSVDLEERRKVVKAMASLVKQELNINESQFRLFFIDLEPNLGSVHDFSSMY